MANEILTSFLGAIQASLSVLLVILYGVIAAQFDILKGDSTKQISTLCVRLFLPALLITKVGSQLHADTGIRYVPILIWGLFYALSSMLLGWLMTRHFRLPSWVTPAISFNNTTALPLLLIESLASTGILDQLLASDTDNVDAALMRAQSYFLVNAMIGDTLTFAMGPKLLDGEHAPEENQDDGDEDQRKPADDGPLEGPLYPLASEHSNGNGTYGARPGGQASRQENNEEPHEQTSLLPTFVRSGELAAERYGYDKGEEAWKKFPPWIRLFFHFSYAFLHAPLLGAITGAILGLVPPFHKAFFGDPENGGIFTAWLTDSVKNIGGLFASLQIVVVGAKLSSSMRKMKRGEDSGTVPWTAVIFVTIMRFIVWPAISIAFIFFLASRTNVLDDDPMLWFAMMLMPTGPPAMKLTALADVSGCSEEEKMSIAKFLSVSDLLGKYTCEKEQTWTKTD
ncbi:MAG: hypothetical protein ASARMPREDX12_002922 [Alectoria sarmentosa]|nr:MAG: hypothetical protein ASARMPREDX12_002922 [Alectoria sarmentosa]